MILHLSAPDAMSDIAARSGERFIGDRSGFEGGRVWRADFLFAKERQLHACET